MSKINWDVVQAIVLVGMLPVMLILGALFSTFFAKYKEQKKIPRTEVVRGIFFNLTKPLRWRSQEK